MNKGNCTWQFFVPFLGWLSDPLQRLGDLQIGIKIKMSLCPSAPRPFWECILSKLLGSKYLLKMYYRSTRVESPGRSIFPTWSIWDIHVLHGHVSKVASKTPFWLFSDFIDFVSANLAINLTYKIRYVWSDKWQFAKFLRIEIFQLWSFELSFWDLISAGWWEAFPLWKFHCILYCTYTYMAIFLKIKH